MTNCLISQRVFKDKHNQIQFSLENNWIDYFKKKKIKLIPILTDRKNLKHYFNKFKPKFVIISGGDNNIFIENKENLIRSIIDTEIIKICKRKKIPILAVCYGFQFIAKKFKSKIIYTGIESRKKHFVYLKNNKKIEVNSYHNYSVKYLPNEFEVIGTHKNGSIEIAYSKKFKILCTMFHPERKNKSKKYIYNLIIKYLNL